MDKKTLEKIPKSIFLMHYTPENTGSVAMAESAIRSIRERYPRSEIVIESDFPDKTRGAFPDVTVVKRAFSIADLQLTDRVFSLDFIRRNSRFLMTISWATFWALLGGACRLRKTPIVGLNAMHRSDLVLSLAGDSISQQYSYGLRFLEFWYIKRHRIPNILYAQSVGPFDGFSRRVASRALNWVSGIIARDKKTIELLSLYGAQVPVYEGADSAIMLPTVESDEVRQERERAELKGADIVGVVIRTSKLSASSGDEYRKYLSGMSNLIGYLRQQGLRVVLFASIVEDYRAADDFRKEFDLDLPIVKLFEYTASEAKGILRHLDFIVSPRMHPVILSSSSEGGVPVIGLGNEFKMEEYLRLLGQERFLVRDGFLPFNEKATMETVARMIQDRESCRKAIERAMVSLIRESEGNMALVDTIYSRYA